MKQKAKTINNNTVFNTLKSIFSVIYPLITFPYISRVLLTDNIGKINFGSSIVSYVSLIASLGITTYAVRECSKVRDDKKALSHISSQVLSINVISTGIAYLGLVIALFAAKPLENYRLLICIQSSAVIFNTLGADWLNTAMEDFKFIAIRTVVVQFSSLLLMFFLVRKPDDYLIYAVITVIASSGANVVNIFYRRRYCDTRFTLRMDVKKHLPAILVLFSLILSQTIYVNSDITILGIIKGDHEVGLYSTSVKIYSIIGTMIASIAWVVMPRLAYHFAHENYPEINKLLKYSLNFILVLGVPCFCGLEVIATQLIYVIAGKAYIDAALSLRILGFAMLFSFIGGWICNMTFLPAGREKNALIGTVISALINIVLNLILIPRWGLNAAALTTAVSQCMGMIYGFLLIDRKIVIEGLEKMLLGPLIGGVGIIAIGMIVKHVIAEAWLVTVVTIAVSVIWYFLVMLVSRNEFVLGFIAPIEEKYRRK